MKSLTIDHFLTAGPDLERAQYSILAVLKSVRDEFARTEVYPHLSELIDLHTSLRKLLSDQLQGIRDAMPGDIETVDFESGKVVHRQSPDLGPMGHIRELIEWATPHLRETIEEGRTIFEFVDSSLSLEQVGILPGYTEEGYLLLPDRDTDELCILRYAMSIVTRSDERYRSLRTSVLKRIPDRKTVPPQHIKLELARQQPELPNPATYYVRSEIGFPFNATLMPIAKRKLMRHLFTHTGLA